VDGRTVGEVDDAVSVGHHALEQSARDPFAVPLAQRAVLELGFEREQREELVDFDVVAELAGLRDVDRVGVLPAQATTLHVALRGDYVGAGLVEYPVIWVGARPGLAPGRAESVEHP
jgi:hypothetical protein